jgi:hypothetical protein
VSAEYEGKQDYGTDGKAKGLKVLPRPVPEGPRMIRALNLTGDPTGFFDVSLDDGMYRQGLEHFQMLQIEAQSAAEVERWRAIDAAWYD